MAGFASVASQLSAAQGAATLKSQAGSLRSTVSGALKSGSKGVKGALGSVVGGRREKAAEFPTDGSCCQECGSGFGLLRRRSTCSSCDRFLCGACLGNQMAGVAGLSCFCSAVCPKCRQQNSLGGEFHACREELEKGVGATISLPAKKSGLFGTSNTGPRRVPVWLQVDTESAELCWGSLEQRQGRPAEEGRIRFGEILEARSTGVALELPSIGQVPLTTIEFSSSSDLEDWSRWLAVALEVLTPEGDRAALEAARSTHRQQEAEERRALNEERKKRLQDGLGMRFTAEAMMNRESTG